MLKKWFKQIGPVSWYKNPYKQFEWIRFDLNIRNRNLIHLVWKPKILILLIGGKITYRSVWNNPTSFDNPWEFYFPRLVKQHEKRNS